MMKKSINITILILILTFHCFGQDDSIENGWKGIKTLKTDKATVEKIVGLPEASKDGYYNYDTKDFFMQVNYSSAPCQKSDYNRGKFNIPENTVLWYHVLFKKETKFADLKLKREQYERQIDRENNSLVYYTNRSEGILISVVIFDGIEHIPEIQFDPTPSDEKKFSCNDLPLRIEKPEESKPAKKSDCDKPE